MAKEQSSSSLLKLKCCLSAAALQPLHYTCACAELGEGILYVLQAAGNSISTRKKIAVPLSDISLQAAQ
ncbi:MAG TPA: hypothetical protein VGO47_14360 [Chlamydiales bacterium]|nr:hypothetical protein [Chlamydiales bacterium]